MYKTQTVLDSVEDFEIANPSILPPQITTKSIKEPHESYPYNLKIAETLYKSMFLKNRGSGAKRIIDACREQGIEEPTWSWNGAFVTIIFKRPDFSSKAMNVNKKEGVSTHNTCTKDIDPSSTP